jgi:hypothetical protein
MAFRGVTRAETIVSLRAAMDDDRQALERYRMSGFEDADHYLADMLARTDDHDALRTLMEQGSVAARGRITEIADKRGDRQQLAEIAAGPPLNRWDEWILATALTRHGLIAEAQAVLRRPISDHAPAEPRRRLEGHAAAGAGAAMAHRAGSHGCRLPGDPRAVPEDGRADTRLRHGDARRGQCLFLTRFPIMAAR